MRHHTRLERQLNPERRAFAKRAVDVDFPAVTLDDALCVRKTHAQPHVSILSLEIDVE